MFSNKVILAAPLDWGLGHATRMVPVIRRLAEKNRVILCVTRNNEALLQLYFPKLQRVTIPSYGVRYSGKTSQTLKVVLSLPSIIRRIHQEHKHCMRLADKFSAEVVISDNRYGFWSPRVHNIFITHQLKFFTRGGGIAGKLQSRIIRGRFGEVWVPDYAEPEARLAGELCSSPSLHEVKYIGPLSALENFIPSNREPLYDYLLLISGPEPQRTLLERALIRKYQGLRANIAVARGTARPGTAFPSGWTVHDLAAGPELADLIVRSRRVVCRSGYSTLMDLHLLGQKEMVLVPTPGQPEQEYLARYWEKKFGAAVVSQQQLLMDA